MKKVFAILTVAALMLTVSVTAFAKTSPTASTRSTTAAGGHDSANRGHGAGSNNAGGNGSNGGNGGDSSTSPVTGDYAVYALVAAFVLGGAAFAVSKKLAK